MKLALVQKPALLLLLLLLFSLFSNACADTTTTAAQDKSEAPFDVIHYEAAVEPDLTNQTIKGTVEIRLNSRRDKLAEVELDSVSLSIEGVWENGAAQVFEARERKLLIRLARPAATNEARTLKVSYHVKSPRGVRFFPDHVYTLYNTRGWMPCQFHPGDKATLTMRLIVPADFKVVANGDAVARENFEGSRTQHTWSQTKPMPAYIFGFAAGRFEELTKQKGGVQLRALFRPSTFTPAEAARVFADTPDILEYYERIAGTPLPGKSYTQVLASGGVEQEMSGFTVMRETYGREVLSEARENWLAVHEFAHEWWGNSLTCADWSHFWLNEGVATFVADAYQGERFGREEYDRQIELARIAYARLRAAGRDRPLAYRHNIEESKAGGPIVYDKGALVLHLLRFQIGEEAFWKGLRNYTRANVGASVTTDDLQTAMERAVGHSLTEFFEHWVYRADVPEIVARHRVSQGMLIVEVEQRQETLWPIPLRIASETNAGRKSHHVWLKEKRHEFSFPLRGNLRAVRLDDGGHLPVRVAHERPILMLLHQLAHEPDLAGRLDALAALELRCGGNKTPKEKDCEGYRAALLRRADADSSRIVRAQLGEALKRAN